MTMKKILQPKPLKDKLPQDLIIPVLDKFTLLKFGAQWPNFRAAIHVCKLNKVGNRNGKAVGGFHI